MTETKNNTGENEFPIPSNIHSLKDLLDIASGKSLNQQIPQEDSGLAEINPYPFFAIMGQDDLKLGLLLSVINPNIGGILLIGPRGTGKTTAARSLLSLLPVIEKSTCYYGCTPKDIEIGGIDSVCPDCAKKYAEGSLKTNIEPMKLIELPLNSSLEDVIGSLDERAKLHHRMRIKKGILAQADQGVLFTDEVNLLPNVITDAILDAASQGTYTVRHGPISATYWARFILIGSMNPEEGSLRPQIMDRFGIRILVKGLESPVYRQEAYRRVISHKSNPNAFISFYSEDIICARKEIKNARQLLPSVELSKKAIELGSTIIKEMQLESLRAELALFEAARAYAAARNSTTVTEEDIRIVAPITLTMRRSSFMAEFVKNLQKENDEIKNLLGRL